MHDNVSEATPNHLRTQISLVTFDSGPSRLLVLRWIYYCLICYEAQWSVRSDSLWRRKHNFTFMWQLHCAIYAIDLSSVHPRCPPELVSRLLFFKIPFMIVDDRSKRLLELQKLYPFLKTWIPPTPLIPLQLLEKLCIEEEAAVELCTQQTELKSETWHTTMHTSSLHAAATPNRDWIHSRVGGFWVSGTIPNKRGFS